MDEAASCRRAARDAVADIEPAPLRDALDDRLRNASMVPGALALLAARATDDDVALEHVAESAAGVQLIYEGLRLTRALSHTEPWLDADLDTDLDADLEVLAADVLVARGFYLLARTAAADRAVDTVRAFGRDQTDRRTAPDPDTLDRNLEADVFDLAIVTGTTAAGGTPDAYRGIARNLVTDADVPLPAAAAFLPDAATLRSQATPAADGGGDESARTSATDP
jgi:hypothetical protein